MNYRTSILLSSLISSLCAGYASADIEPDNVAQASAIIKDMATTICGELPYDGKTQSKSLSAEATLKVNSLLKQVADIGGSVKGDISQSGYYGVLQEQLGTTIKDNQDCRKHIWDDLKVMFVQPVTLPKPTVKPVPKDSQPDNIQLNNVKNTCSPVLIGADNNALQLECTK